MSNLSARILVALVGIPLMVLVTMLGGVYFFVMIAIISTLGLHEFYVLARAKGASPQVGMGMFFGVCVNLVFLFDKVRYSLLTALAGRGIAAPAPTMTQTMLILLLLFLLLVFVVELFRNKGSPLLNIAITITGVLYVSLFLGSLIGIRELFIPADFPVYLFFDVKGAAVSPEISSTIYDWGCWTVVAIFASIWSCDSASYFVGRSIGRHKLFERISPNKTWEGSLAGFILAVAVFMVASDLLLPYLTRGNAFVCGAAIGVFGQLGDLVESLLKRDAGVKDSSTLIPGHGGVLDRFDSLILVSPVLFLYLDFVVF